MAEFDIMYGQGISREGDVLDCAVEAKVVEKAGSWYSYDGNRIGQGRENVKNFLKDNPEILEKIAGQIKESFQPVTIVADEDGVIIE
jgi:recombination protein RecA